MEYHALYYASVKLEWGKHSPTRRWQNCCIWWTHWGSLADYPSWWLHSSTWKFHNYLNEYASNQGFTLETEAGCCYVPLNNSHHHLLTIITLIPHHSNTTIPQQPNGNEKPTKINSIRRYYPYSFCWIWSPQMKQFSV